MTRDNLQQTVRPGPLGRVPKTLCALTFVATAVAVYQWGRLHAERADSAADHTATAMVRWQATTPADNTDHSLSPELQSFARDTDRAFDAAQAAAYRAEADTRAARTQLDEFYQRQLESRKPLEAQPQGGPAESWAQTPPATVPAEPEPVENPEWTTLHGQLEELQGRRTALLRDRTAEHPAVKDIDFRVADVASLLATKPRWLATERPNPQPLVANGPWAASPPPVGPPANGVAAADRDRFASSPDSEPQVEASEVFAKLKDAVGRAEQAQEAAARRARQAWQAMLSPPQIEVEPAATCETSSTAVADLSLLLTALGSAFLATLGTGMILAAARREPTVGIVAEVEALVPVPVVGIVPAAVAAVTHSRIHP